jgi:hypothetical protein
MPPAEARDNPSVHWLSKDELVETIIHHPLALYTVRRPAPTAAEVVPVAVCRGWAAACRRTVSPPGAPAPTESTSAGMNGQQAGDPAKLAKALVAFMDEPQPPPHFMAGADSVGLAEQKVADLREQHDAFRELSTSLAIEEADTTAEPASA